MTIEPLSFLFGFSLGLPAWVIVENLVVPRLAHVLARLHERH